MADLQAKIVFSVENGQLVINQLNGVQQKMGGLKSGVGGISQELKALMPALSAVAIGKFLYDSVKAAEKASEAYRKLRFELETQGIAWGSVEKEIKNYADTMGKSTRFGHTEYLEVLGSMTRKLGDLEKAYSFTTLAADIASQSNMTMAQVADLLGNAMANPARGALMLRREFKAIVGDGKNVNEMMQKLYTHFNGAAQAEQSFTKEMAIAKEEIDKMKEGLGVGMLPIITQVVTEWEKWAKAIHIIKQSDAEVNAKDLANAENKVLSIKKAQNLLDSTSGKGQKERRALELKVAEDNLAALKAIIAVEERRDKKKKAGPPKGGAADPEKKAGLEKKIAEETAEFAKNEEEKVAKWDEDFNKKAEERLKTKADAEEADRKFGTAADAKYLKDEQDTEDEKDRIAAEGYQKRLAIGMEFANAEKTLVEDLISGDKDAWKNFYKAMIDLAFTGAEAKLTANVAEAWSNAFLLLSNPITAFYAPTAFGAAGAVTAELAGLELAKGLFKLPAMAEGGIVKAIPGGRSVIVGEGGRDEAIVPLGPGTRTGGTVNIHIHGTVIGSVNEIVKEIKKLNLTGNKPF